MSKKLIIQVPYGGMGDHLFHSHLPRIAKQTNAYSKVFFSTKSNYRSEEIIDLIWKLNPYIDGFVEDEGISCDLSQTVNQLEKKNGNKTNLLDEIMYSYGLDDGEVWHEPEIYYVPKFVSEYNKSVYDPNYISWVGELDVFDVDIFFKKNKIKFDSVMNIRSEKALFINKGEIPFINTPALTQFCDLICSCTQLYCLTSGTATLAASLKKPAIVFYGEKQPNSFQHSKIHTYILIKKCYKNRFNLFLKKRIRNAFNYFNQWKKK